MSTGPKAVLSLSCDSLVLGQASPWEGRAGVASPRGDSRLNGAAPQNLEPEGAQSPSHSGIPLPAGCGSHLTPPEGLLAGRAEQASA